jgi:hypothetical protein
MPRALADSLCVQPSDYLTVAFAGVIEYYIKSLATEQGTEDEL